MYRRVWRATVHGVKEPDMTEQLTDTHTPNVSNIEKMHPPPKKKALTEPQVCVGL